MRLGAVELPIERAPPAQHVVEDVSRDAARGESGNLGGRYASGCRCHAVLVSSRKRPIQAGNGRRITSRIVTKRKRDGSVSLHSARNGNAPPQLHAAVM